MYLYYDKNLSLRTKIDHGEKIRQGSDFNVFVCLDEDFPFETDNYSISATIKYKDNVVGVHHISEEGKQLIEFQKLYPNENTSDFVEGQVYWTYQFKFSSKPYTQNAGNIVLNLTIDYLGEDDEMLGIVRTFGSAELFVEKTVGYGKQNIPVSNENYSKIVEQINKIEAKKLDKTEVQSEIKTIDGKPILLSKEKLDLVSEEVVLKNLDTLIEQLTRLNDKNLFDPTGLENVYRYDLQFIDGFLQLKENGTIINQYNLTTFVADKTNHFANSINELISKDSDFAKQLVDIRARLIAIEATGGGGTGTGTGGSVDLSQYYTKEQIDFTISGINEILESIPETYATNVGVANLEIELTKRIMALEEAESDDTIDLSGYLQKPVDACTEDTQILIGNTNGTLEYSTLTVKEINNRLEILESNSGGSSETTKSNVVKIFGGESNMNDFSNFDATKGGFILFYGILETEEYDGRFQMIVPLREEFINGTYYPNGFDTYMLVYGDLLSAGTEVAINIDGKNNSFRGFMCQNCYVLEAYHIY